MSSVKNILIADYDQAICQVLQRILQDSGYQVFMARNGKEAVEKVESKEEQPPERRRVFRNPLARRSS